MVVKIATSEPPTELTTVRIATPMPAAIRPHSIAVTPLRSPLPSKQRIWVRFSAPASNSLPLPTTPH
jgi:hypothetical protein